MSKGRGCGRDIHISVEVRHHKNFVCIWGRVGSDLQAGIVEKFSIELDVWELFANLVCGVKEEPIGHLHDSGFVHDTNLFLASFGSILECVAENTLGGLFRDELDRLDNAGDYNVLDA